MGLDPKDLAAWVVEIDESAKDHVGKSIDPWHESGNEADIEKRERIIHSGAKYVSTVYAVNTFSSCWFRDPYAIAMYPPHSQLAPMATTQAKSVRYTTP